MPSTDLLTPRSRSTEFSLEVSFPTTIEKEILNVVKWLVSFAVEHGKKTKQNKHKKYCLASVMRQFPCAAKSIVF